MFSRFVFFLLSLFSFPVLKSERCRGFKIGEGKRPRRFMDFTVQRENGNEAYEITVTYQHVLVVLVVIRSRVGIQSSFK